MTFTAELEECLKDSPRFRASLEVVEVGVGDLETKLDKLVKLCGGMIEAGKAYNVANKHFLGSIKELAGHCHNDNLLVDTLKHFSEGLEELVGYHLILYDQAQRCIRTNLQTFIKEDVRGFKESRRSFERAAEELEIALARHVQVPRTRPHEAEEARNLYLAARKSYRHTALEHLIQTHDVQAKNKLVVLDSVCSYLRAQFTFFHQGYDWLNDLEPEMKQLAVKLDEFRQVASQERKEMEASHASVEMQVLANSTLGVGHMMVTFWSPHVHLDVSPSPHVHFHVLPSPCVHLDVSLSFFTTFICCSCFSILFLEDPCWREATMEFRPDLPQGVVLEGYLFKRASNAFKTWNRRWFSIQSRQLVYQKKYKEPVTVVVEDLRLCSVKPIEETERRFCFEVSSPPAKTCVLQAESEELRELWVRAVQTSINLAYNDTTDKQEEAKTSPSQQPISENTTLQANQPGIGAGSDTLQQNPGVTIPSAATSQPPTSSALRRIQAVQGNQCCCDCGREDARWASINLGVSLCIECSGIHRSLGVHLSKVRSLTLDTWEPELIKVMCELGNNEINKIYESNTESSTLKKPPPGSSRKEREAWIRAKYVERRFLCPRPRRVKPGGCGKEGSNVDEGCVHQQDEQLETEPGVEQRQKTAVSEHKNGKEEGGSEVEVKEISEDCAEWDPGLALQGAARRGDLRALALAIAHGGDVNYVHRTAKGTTPLIQAVIGNSLAVCEFLLQNGAKVNHRDDHGRSPLHHATYLGHTGQVCMFLKRGASQIALDEAGQDPLSVAVQAANADIVTLLRLARMYEEMRESEGPYPQEGDATYHDIFRDFSHLASNEPDRLTRSFDNTPP
uniref:arf-GAP with coiled-coil, ANK repeat and PH domain-containing protein 2-like isoform X2 n=1 Tax=Myxine glutinosa TaxID=7769 RepID=UPI00358F3F60